MVFAACPPETMPNGFECVGFSPTMQVDMAVSKTDCGTSLMIGAWCMPIVAAALYGDPESRDTDAFRLQVNEKHPIGWLVDFHFRASGEIPKT
jgi:hypothetical protein